MSAEQIEAAANGLSLFQGLELFLIIATVVGLVFIIFLGPKLLDKRYKFKMAELNKENQNIEMETNALVKEVAGRLNRLEENVVEFRLKISDLEKEKINQKMLARDVLKGIFYNEMIDMANRLEAARDFLKLGGNGEGKKLIKKLVMGNKALWNYIVDQDNKNFTNDEMKEYYHTALDEIKKAVLW